PASGYLRYPAVQLQPYMCWPTGCAWAGDGAGWLPNHPRSPTTTFTLFRWYCLASVAIAGSPACTYRSRLYTANLDNAKVTGTFNPVTLKRSGARVARGSVGSAWAPARARRMATTDRMHRQRCVSFVAFP